MKVTIALAFLSGIAVSSLCASSTGAVHASAARDRVGVEKMLEGFVSDYRGDAMAEGPITFGILVNDADEPEWHVVIEERSEGVSEAPVQLEIGFPEEPMPYFVTDVETLTRIYNGELASLTAMGKAFSTDFAPLDTEFMPGFEATEETARQMMVLSFHFWTRGFPEVVRFGDLSATREMHGGNGVLFYYQPGFRSGWFLVQPGQHINEDVHSRTNPFPTLVVCTKGVLRARIGGTECDLNAGETIFIGPDISHEFWVTGSEAAEGILLMFGEGA